MPKTPVVPAAVLRIRVRTRSGRPLQKATVSVDSPALTADTDATGFVKLTLTDDQLKALAPSNQITLHTKKRHHGPDPGPGKSVVPGEIKLTPTVGSAGFDPKTPGLNSDKRGPFLDLVLMDAGFNFGVATPAVVTRRLTDDQVDLVAAGYLAGLTLNELASAFGADRRTLASRLEQRGIARRGRRLTPTDITDATRLYLEGWSLARIANRLGVYPESVRYQLQKHGISLRPRPGHSKTS